jgi:hypothetical protein
VLFTDARYRLLNNKSRNWNQADTRSKFEETPSQLRMEIFDGLYMRSRLSPSLSLKPEVEKVKTRLFSCFRLILGFFIFALLTKN